MSDKVNQATVDKMMAEAMATAQSIIWSDYLRQAMLKVKPKLLADELVPRAVWRYLKEKGVKQFDYYFKHNLEDLSAKEAWGNSFPPALLEYNQLRDNSQEELRLVRVPVAEIGFYEAMARFSHEHYQRPKLEVTELLLYHHLCGHLRVLREHCERYDFMDEVEALSALSQCLVTYVECRERYRRQATNRRLDDDESIWLNWRSLMDKLEKK